MKLKKWDQLPENMRNDAVRPYYELLKRKRVGLFFKRCFDLFASLVLLVLLSPLFLILAIAIKADSPGRVFYRQERVTQYGRRFYIHKFRTMVSDADKRGSLVTVAGDSRVTRVGRYIRRLRLDETAQLLDVISGDMTLVGARPEIPRYVEEYTDEMLATLLLPAGVTGLASICYKDEAELLKGECDVDRAYLERVLPGKMRYNLEEIKKFGFWNDIALMLRTVVAVLK